MMVAGKSILSSDSFSHHWNLHPKVYVAPYTSTPLCMDGNLDKWSSIPWSTDFDEIRGIDAPADARPNVACRTRIKMQWDKQFLYILALMDSDREIRATFTERNSPIFQQDCDFEVFIDPSGSCHAYKELEVNALNTVWNLMLDKPYSDGGSEHSGRVAKPGEANYYEVQSQSTFVKMIEGSLNDKTTSQNNVWAVEIALCHEDTFVNQRSAKLPVIGDLWRINFSRVEELGSINWTWQPQIAWDPSQHRHSGFVNMHLPDAWGYVLLGTELSCCDSASPWPTAGELPRDLVRSMGDMRWPGRLAAMNIYYAQQQYRNVYGVFASEVDSLEFLIDDAILLPFRDSGIEIISGNGHFFTCRLFDCDRFIFEVTHDRLLTIRKES